ncbi:chromatin binding protein [Blastocladiella emersonii ATCC 22665]|nr:chromatin binding protein [Blastocladiella emersonii ATCC 22665]
MNIPLLESWLDPYPAQIDQTVNDTSVTSVRFSRRGNHLACACSTGAVQVWDVDTMAVLRTLHGHAAAVSSVSWSRSGRYLASGALDWRCIVWDVATGLPVHDHTFGSPVTHVAFHPYLRSLVLVSLAKSAPVLLHADSGAVTPLPSVVPPEHVPAAAGFDGLDVIATWDPLGRFIFAGTSKGMWSVATAPSAADPVPRVVFSDKLAGTAVREFAPSRSGQHLAITVADKTIRTYMLPYVPAGEAEAAAAAVADEVHFECIPVLKLQDLVNRHSWIGAAWTGGASERFVVGGTGRSHAMCLWSRATGTLVKLIEGPTESLVSLAWHPVLPLCVTVSQHGTLYVWSSTPKDKWSAFAPDFKELDDNIEYEEREDEFDIIDEASLLSPTAASGTGAPAGLATGFARRRPNVPPAETPVLDLLTPAASAMPLAAPPALRANPDADLDESWVLTVPLEDPLPELFNAGQSAASLVRVQRDEAGSRGKRKRDD